MANDVRRVQERLLGMGQIISKILDCHDIPHMIFYGTFLGAIRHHGFIPWDDDFDFVIFNDYYDEAINLLRKELPDDLFLEDNESEPKYFHAWAHVKDLKSNARCEHFWQDGVYAHQGLSVDLYRIEKVELKNLIPRFEEENYKYISRRKELGLMDDCEIENRLSILKMYVNEWIVYKESHSEHENLDREVYATLYSNRTFFEIDNIFPLKKYKFEDVEFWGPNNANEVLTRQYFDYMTLPPEEARVPHYSDVEFF